MPTIVPDREVLASRGEIDRGDVAEGGTCRWPVCERGERWEVHLGVVRTPLHKQNCGTYETHLVFLGVARDGEQLRVVVEAEGRNWGCEVRDGFQETGFVG